MSCLFRPDQLIELTDEQAKICSKADKLVDRFISHNYLTETGSEHGIHGLCRRVGSISRCIENIYRLLPPAQVKIPDKDILHDAEMNIQAAVFHVYGALDNLAFVWAFERQVTGKNGQPLRNTQIGFSPEKTEVWASLPGRLQMAVSEMGEWRKNLDSFRHALGHRIPLYIPPFLVDPQNLDKYHRLENESADALRAHRFDEYQSLRAASHAMRHSKPMMLHSLTELTPPICFHSQLLADFNTIELLSMLIFDELEAVDVTN